MYILYTRVFFNHPLLWHKIKEIQFAFNYFRFFKFYDFCNDVDFLVIFWEKRWSKKLEVFLYVHVWKSKIVAVYIITRQQAATRSRRKKKEFPLLCTTAASACTMMDDFSIIHYFVLFIFNILIIWGRLIHNRIPETVIVMLIY